MEIPFSLPLTGFRSRHVTHFQPVRPEEQSVSLRWGLGWGGQVEGNADEKIFITPEKTRKKGWSDFHFSLLCMCALTGINSDIASILMMKPAWRMAGGRDEKKLGPDDVTELQCQAILTRQSYCVRSHNCSTQSTWGMFCYLDIQSSVMSITSFCSSLLEVSFRWFTLLHYSSLTVGTFSVLF